MILAGSGISTVPNSVITGDIGVSPIAGTAFTGFGETADSTVSFSTSNQVTGNLYAADYVGGTTSDRLTTAVGAMGKAYNEAGGRAVNYTNLHAGDISNKTLTRGVYNWTTDVSINEDVTLRGGADDVFIFQISGKITQADSKRIILDGVQAKNIFWQAADTVSIGTGAHFKGNILAATNIQMLTNSSIEGRLLAGTAVTLDQSTVTIPE